MPNLLISDKKIDSIFELLGDNEDDISYSIGWCLANSTLFLTNLLTFLNITIPSNINETIINLQKYEKGFGRTDIEISLDNHFHIIIEAKNGWIFPTASQTDKYQARDSYIKSNAIDKRIIVLNQSNEAYVQARYNDKIQVITWDAIVIIATNTKGSQFENRILKQLITYLNKIITMQRLNNNIVWIVPLNEQKPNDGSITFLDIVEKRFRYFHPIGGQGGWRTEPPTYIGFRYYGQLQSIHFIEHYEVFTDPNIHFPEIPSIYWRPHYLYHLGPAITPGGVVKNGKGVQMTTKYYAAIDLLLTSNTIREAVDLTNLRQNNR